jgi:hypothetical protein
MKIATLNMNNVNKRLINLLDWLGTGVMTAAFLVERWIALPSATPQ